MEIVAGVHAIERLGVGRAYLYEEADRLKRYGPQPPTTVQRFSALERRLARLEAFLAVQDGVEVAASQRRRLGSDRR